MWSLYQTLSLRYLSRRWVRALLIVASIALGVATLVATRALNGTMTQAVIASSNPMAGITDFVISASDKLPVSRDLAKSIAGLRGVQYARPRIFKNAYLPALGKEVLVMGIDIFDEFKGANKNVADITLSEGTQEAYAALMFFQTPVVVGQALANDLPPVNKQEPATMDLKVKRDHVHAVEHTLKRVGTLSAKGDAAALGGYVLILDLANAARVLGMKEDQASRIDVVLHPGTNPEDVRPELDRVVAHYGQVRTPEEQNESRRSAMAGMQTGFALCGIGALVVGMFLVYNALSVTVAERRHEIGILLSLGATRGQVLRMFGVEAGLLGITGSLLGLPLGILLAQIGLGPIQDILKEIFQNFSARGVEVGGDLVVLSLIAGTLTAMVAALVPAWQASRENPAEAVRRVQKAPSVRSFLAQIVTSLSLIVVGTLLILLRSHIPYRLGSYGGLCLVLVGALVASPFLAGIAARLFQPVARRFLGLEWRLAADNLVRSPGRTGLVIGALAAGVSLVVQTAGVINSNQKALRDWIQDSIAADLIVTSGGPVSAGLSVDMPESLGAELRAVPGVENALPLRMSPVDYGKTKVYLIAMDTALAHEREKNRLKGNKDIDLLRKLSDTPDTVVVSENFAALHRVRAGDTIQLPSPKGVVRLKVIGEIVDYTWNHGSLLLDRRDYLRHWEDAEVSVFDLYLHPGTDPAKMKDIINQKFGSQYQLYALTRDELQTHIDGVIQRLYGIAYGQQVVVMLVAALGVVMALLISVLQRRREMGLLRAIGASQGQVIRSVLAEACLMGVIGTLIGLLVGIPLQWYVLNVVILEESGYLFPVYIPWMGGLIIAGAAMVIATLAGLGPAIYAVKTRIPEAIAYE